ncbi:MAG: EamA family transporter RarD [Calditerrivibrio nitroreducens]|jgi:chloramphenicol-sensitive protein RarD|uniref:EamA family transporter RarD n=1 Tax=Calditerrivibrio nitroreducens TaxID=477976 RepID=A0A2J6WRA1_9BACT|nr:MAG: EamA family transporter RarD [Calditerrivibrio nitroreducens]
MKESTKGFLSGLAAYSLWGIFPIYWKFLKEVNPFEIVFHRIIWSFLFLNLILLLQRQLRETLSYLKDKKILKYFLLSSLMIGSNWFLYIWAVNTGKILETSLGYYMAPIFNVLLGRIVLKEKMTKGRAISFTIVVIALLNMILGLNHLPWVSVILAITFSYYGFLRKNGKLGSIQGLFVETLVMGIPSFLLIIYLSFIHKSSFLTINYKIDTLLILSGPATAIPLLTFAYAARRLQFITLGIMQYIAPTIAFFIGAFLYKEPLNFKYLITFILIWIALIIYILDSYIIIYRYKKN